MSQTFRRNHDFQDLACDPPGSTHLGQVGNPSRCAVLCERLPGCNSFFFNHVTKSCRGAASVLTTVCGLPDTGSVYFVRDVLIGSVCTGNLDCIIENTTCQAGKCACGVAFITEPVKKQKCIEGATNHGGVCESSGDCYGPHVECGLGGMCICNPAYSFRPATKTCEPSCSPYGSTFQIYPDMTLSCALSMVYPSYTPQMCMDECLATDCVTIRYNHDITECKLDTCTVLTNPGDYGPWDGVDFYMRNCA
ncbi:uncharacterized protein LOC128223545 [Mya arenaria]|nr:uncharacterized protein LOC128223545 [Mya arenaria]